MAQFDAIDNFLARVKKLPHSTNKELRLTFEDANLLTADIASLMIALAKGGSIGSPTVLTPKVLDGGGFKD